MIKLKINIALIFIIILSSIIYSQDSNDKRFADFLFEKGEYYRAITEYYRLLYNCEKTDQKINLLKNIGLSYYQGEDFEGCIDFLKSNRLSFLSDSLVSNEMDLLISNSYYRIGQYSNVISILNWQYLKSSEYFKDKFLFLSGISYSRLFQVEKAIDQMKHIQQKSTKKEVADRFVIYFQDLNNVSNKSPFLAGTLSAIIPGSGYLYSKHYETALTSFIINGLIIWAVHDAIKEKQYGIASAATVFGLGWYIGNIEGSAKAAVKQNEYERNKYLNEVLEKEGLTEYIDSK